MSQFTKITVLAIASTLIVANAPAGLADSGHGSSSMTGAIPMSQPMGQEFHSGPRFQAMVEQMEQIHSTQDPEERKALLKSHLETMREAMEEMHGGPCVAMSGSGMMPQGMMGGMGMPQGMMGGMGMPQGMMGGMMPQGMMGGMNMPQGPMGRGYMDPAIQNRMGMMEQQMQRMQTMMKHMLENQAQSAVE